MNSKILISLGLMLLIASLEITIFHVFKDGTPLFDHIYSNSAITAFLLGPLLLYCFGAPLHEFCTNLSKKQCIKIQIDTNTVSAFAVRDTSRIELINELKVSTLDTVNICKAVFDLVRDCFNTTALTFTIKPYVFVESTIELSSNQLSLLEDTVLDAGGMGMEYHYKEVGKA